MRNHHVHDLQSTYLTIMQSLPMSCVRILIWLFNTQTLPLCTCLSTHCLLPSLVQKWKQNKCLKGWHFLPKRFHGQERPGIWRQKNVSPKVEKVNLYGWFILKNWALWNAPLVQSKNCSQRYWLDQIIKKKEMQFAHSRSKMMSSLLIKKTPDRQGQRRRTIRTQAVSCSNYSNTLWQKKSWLLPSHTRNLV